MFEKKSCYWWIFVIGICLYFPMISEWLANPDAVGNPSVYYKAEEWENALGRIGLPVFSYITDNIIGASLFTILCILCLVYISKLVCDILNIKDNKLVVLTGMILLLSPCFMNTLSYYYCALPYMFSYLLNVLAVWIIIRDKDKYALLEAILCIAIGYSLYQAYISVCMTLCIGKLIVELLDDSIDMLIIKKHLKKFLIAGGGGTVLYLGAVYTLRRFEVISVIDNRGFNTIGQIDIFEIPELVVSAYLNFARYYLGDSMVNNVWMLRYVWNVMIIGMALLGILLIIRGRHIALNRIVYMVILGAIAPLCFMIIVVIAPDVSIFDVTGIIMLPSMNYIYIYALLIINSALNGKDKLLKISRIPFGILVYIMILYIIVFQNCMKMNLNQTYSVALHVSNKISEIDADNEKRVVFIGDIYDGNYKLIQPELYDIVSWTVAPEGMIWETTDGRQGCWRNFFRYYCGIDYEYIDINDCEMYENSLEVKEMPIFPTEGSVKKIGQHVIVKFSE